MGMRSPRSYGTCQSGSRRTTSPWSSSGRCSSCSSALRQGTPPRESNRP
uniref:Uncharacterized protein n=1 Tax=Arundo donax TaxID=35708 RepID=A0A0A9H0T8_ARUDO